MPMSLRFILRLSLSQHSISQTLISQSTLLYQRMYSFDTFLFFYILAPDTSDYWYLKRNLLEPENFTLKYQYFEMNFESEISRVDCIC